MARGEEEVILISVSPNGSRIGAACPTPGSSGRPRPWKSTSRIGGACSPRTGYAPLERPLERESAAAPRETTGRRPSAWGVRRTLTCAPETRAGTCCRLERGARRSPRERRARGGRGRDRAARRHPALPVARPRDAGAGGHRPRDPRAGVRRPRRPVGLREDDDAADPRRADQAHQRRGDGRAAARCGAATAATTTRCASSGSSSRTRTCSPGTRSRTTSGCRSCCARSTARSAAGARTSSASSSACRASRRRCRASSPAACASASRSPGRSATTPRSC